MVLSQKRGHARTLVGPETTENSIFMEGAKLTHLLRKSLLDSLMTGATPAASDVNDSGFRDSESQPDIYHQYLNATPIVTSKSSITERVDVWLSSARAMMGVGSNTNTLKFWNAHGSGNEGSFADGRYMVWLVQEIILGLVAVEGLTSTAEGWNDNGRYYDDEILFRDHVLEVLDHWQQSAIDLLSKNTAKVGATRHGADVKGGDNAAGVMWRLLLQNAYLTPGELRDAFENFSPPQHEYQKDVRPRGSSEGDNLLPPEYFAWPTFFRCAAFESARYHTHEQYAGSNHPSKRRRSNDSTTLFVGDGTKANDWWPLFGYLIAYALLASPIKMTAEQKIIFLKENVVTSLPSMMLIHNFDHKTRNSLLSGIAACIFDKIGDWMVLDGLELSRMDDADSAMVMMNEYECNRHRANLCRLIDLMLVDGVLPNLADLTSTPLSHLVSVMADAFLNYSEVVHELRFQRSLLLSSNDEDNENSFNLMQKYVANDGNHVVHFIEQANSQLKLQLTSRKIIRSYYTNTPAPDFTSVHPVAVYVRALLLSNNLTAAADLSCTLEDCTGIDDATKKLCYYMLFDKWQDTGLLFEDSWNNTTKGSVTLANISLGAIGRDCALEYLKGVVSMAKEDLLSSSLRHDRAKLERLRCIKDMVRRTTLKFLLPRAYSPHEALSAATTISDATDFPPLENTAWGTAGDKSAVDVVHCILTARRLYSSCNEKVVSFKDVIEQDVDDYHGGELELHESPQEKTADSKHADSFELGSPINEVQHSCGNQESEVFDLEDTEEEEEEDEEGGEAESFNTQLGDSSALISSSNVNNFIQSEAEEEIISDDTTTLKGESRLTYPRNYHQFSGNYSESDDYDQEDDEEADRHLAYEGMYDVEEGRGESEGEEYNDEPDEDVIEILSSDEDEEGEDDYNDCEENADVDLESLKEEKSETEILNEAVDQFIANTERLDGDAEANHASDDEDNERAYEQDDLRIISTNVAKNGINESGEMAGGSGTSAYDDHTLALRMRAKVNSMVEDNEEFHADSCTNGSAHVDDALYSAEEFARDTTDTDDMQMADDEYESIDTEDDKRSFAATSADADDDKSSSDQVGMQERGSLEHAMKAAPLLDDAPLNTSKEHNSDDEKPSVLVAAAMSSQRVGNYPLSARFSEETPGGDSQSFDDTSAAQGSRDVNLWENYDDVSQGEIDEGGTVDVQVARYLSQDLALRSTAGLLPNACDTREDSSPETAEETEFTDDGYVPDAEVTEEETASRALNGNAFTLGVVDDGYVPDTEFTEDDRTNISSKREERSVVKPWAARSSSIDGHDTFTERLQVEIIPAKVIDAGYLPDGHTTACEASEDERCDDAVGASASQAVRRREVSEQNPFDDMPLQGGSPAQTQNEMTDLSQDKPAPALTRMDDSLGSSAVHETENFSNEQDDLSIEMSSSVKCSNFIASAPSDNLGEHPSSIGYNQGVVAFAQNNVATTTVAEGDDSQTEVELAGEGNQKESEPYHVDADMTQTEVEESVDENQDESEPSRLPNRDHVHFGDARTEAKQTVEDNQEESEPSHHPNPVVNAGDTQTEVEQTAEDNQEESEQSHFPSRDLGNAGDAPTEAKKTVEDNQEKQKPSRRPNRYHVDFSSAQTEVEQTVEGNQDENKPSRLQKLEYANFGDAQTEVEQTGEHNQEESTPLPNRDLVNAGGPQTEVEQMEEDNQGESKPSRLQKLDQVHFGDAPTEAKQTVEDNQEKSKPSHFPNRDFVNAGDTQTEVEQTVEDNQEESKPPHLQKLDHVNAGDVQTNAGSTVEDTGDPLEIAATGALAQEQKFNRRSQMEFEDFSRLTVAKLRERLKKLNLSTTGRKQVLIERLVRRLNERLHPNHVQFTRNESQSLTADQLNIIAVEQAADHCGREDADAGESKAATSISNALKTDSGGVRSKQNKSGHPPKSLPVRESKRVKNPSLKAVALQSLSTESVFDDEEQMDHFSKRKNVTSSSEVIVANRGGGDVSPAIPVVPEGHASSGATLSGVDAIHRLLSMEYAETEAKRKTGEKKEDRNANNHKFNAPINPRSKRKRAFAVEGAETTAPVLDVPKRGRRTTRATFKDAGETKTTSESDKGDIVKDISSRTIRTTSKKSAVDVDAGHSSLQRSTRCKTDIKHSAEKESPQKRGPSRPSKSVKIEETIKERSTATTRLKTRSALAKSDEPTSLGVRSSKRLRSKK